MTEEKTKFIIGDKVKFSTGYGNDFVYGVVDEVHDDHIHIREPDYIKEDGGICICGSSAQKINGKYYGYKSGDGYTQEIIKLADQTGV